MRHLVISAHPRRHSFNRAVVEAYRAAARGLGHQVEIRDLYAGKFDPVLTIRDVGITPGRRPPRDVAREQKAIRRADVIAFIAPLWWSGLPAMLKGYLDRVFSAGFAYLIDRRGNYLPAFKNKRAVMIVTSGATSAELKSGGTLRAFETIYDGLIEFCGIKVLGHLYLSGIEPGMSRRDGARRLKSVGRFVRGTFRQR